MKKKPTGVIVLGVFAILQAIPSILFLFGSHSLFSRLNHALHGRFDLMDRGIGLFVFFGLIAGYFILTGIGMFLYKNWARIMFLINTWLAVISEGISALIYLVLVFIQPIFILAFIVTGIFFALSIYIIKYLNKDEIIAAFSELSSKSDSYSIPSDFGEPIQSEEDDFNDFEQAENQRVILEPTAADSRTRQRTGEDDRNKTKLISSQASIIAMIIEDLGNGRYRSHNITNAKTTIGRDPSNAICIKNNDTVGRQHAQVLFRQGKFWLHDLASTNGSFVNGKKVEKHDLIEGDEIRLGTKILIFKSL